MSRRGERPHRSAARRAERRQDDGADGEADAEAGDARAVLGDPRADDDVGRPARRRRQEVGHPGGVAVELDAPEDDDADRGQRQGCRVASTAGHRRGDGDRADELDRHALAEVGAVDGQVEERVHRRRGDPEDRRRGELPAGPPAPERAGHGEHGDRRADDAQPGDRLRRDLVEQQDGDRRAEVLGDRRQDEQRLGRGGVEESRSDGRGEAPLRCPSGHGATRTARGRCGRSPARAAGS